MTKAPSPGDERVSSAFISYSRKNRDFAKRLNDALNARNRKTWIDLEGIPISSDWLKEIESAIEAADACVFVLSPDWAASEICRSELDYAVKYNKRLVPVVRAEPDNRGYPETLRRINWLFCREHDELGDAVEQLVHTLDTDLDYVKMHSRLLVRAREWESAARDKSYLLQGNDLSGACAWLRAAGDREPAATSLHSEYIEASQAAAARRKRYLVAGTTFAAVLIVVVGLFIASQQGISDSRQFASSSAQRLARGDPDTALWLAVQAGDSAQTPEAERALALSLARQETRACSAIRVAFFARPMRRAASGS